MYGGLFGRNTFMKENKEFIKKILTTVLLLIPIMCVCLFVFLGDTKASAATTGTVTAESLFVRTGPGTENDVLTAGETKITLSKGDYVAVYWEEDGWYKVAASFNGKQIEGYVSKKYVTASGDVPTGRPTSTPTPTASASGAIVPNGYTLAVYKDGFPLVGRITVGTMLNVRDGAGTSNNITDTLTDGQNVTITSVEKDQKGTYWYSIDYIKDNKACTGFVSSSYVAVKIKTEVPAEVKEKTPVLVTKGFPLWGTVIADALNVRESTSTSSDRVAILVENASVSVLSYHVDTKGTYWYKVTFSKNNNVYTGYVVSDYVYIDSPDATPTPAPATATPVPTRDPYGNLIRYYEIPTADRGDIYYSATVSADVLNIRGDASVHNLPIGKLTADTRILILEQLTTGNGWYKIAAKEDGKIITGYVSADYVTIDYDDNVYALVVSDNTYLKSSAISSASNVKNASGTDVVFSKNDKVLVVGETLTSSGKWFRLRTNDGTEGLVSFSAISLTGGNVITSVPTPTPTKTPTPTVTPKFTATPTPTRQATNTPTPTALPSPVVNAALTPHPYHMDGKALTGYGVVDTGAEIPAYDRPRTSVPLTDKNGNEIYITSDITLALFDIYKSEEGDSYRHVRFVYNDKLYYGFVDNKYITELDKETAELKITPTPIPDLSDYTEDQFYDYLKDQGFTESYITILTELHEKYPNWVFEAYNTGLDWATVIEKESKVGVNLIPNTSISSMLSTADGAYDWLTDKYTVYDSPYWVTASEDAVAYYMDPRNWLNSSSIFMFETLNYKSKYQTLEQVEKMLKGTPFYETTFTYTDSDGKKKSMTYAEAFIAAAEYADISPYHLVTRVKQEVLTSNGTVSNSVTGTVSGYTGLYNFYNIGAYHSTVTGGAIINGLKYAKNGSANNDAYNDASLIPWTDPYRAIVGGAYIIAQQYIARGQDTIYLQKFNVTDINTYSHQYMANVVAPYSEGTKLANGYSDINTTIVFKIPVYYNMPDSPAAKPTVKGNPNNMLKSLNVYDIYGNSVTLTPTFDALDVTDYYLTTTSANSVLQIVAEAVNEKATVTGTGMIAVGTNADVYEIKVTAENGDIRTYRIHTSKQ